MNSRVLPLAAAVGCIGTALLLQGCIGVAIKGVQVMNDKVIHPAQPVLRGSADFLDDTLVAEVSVRPNAKRRHFGVTTLLGETDSGDELPDFDASEATEKARLALWISFTNYGPETTEFTVQHADSAIGSAVPTPVPLALAPGQRVLLAPFRSLADANQPALDLTLTLQHGATVETKHANLIAIPEVSFHATGIDGAAFAATDGSTPATVWVFIAHDCPISNEYAPLLHRLSTEFSKNQVQWRLVYAEPGLSLADLRAHAQSYALTSPAIADPDLRISRACGIAVTPEVAVIDAQGSLVYRGRIDDRYADLARKRLQPQLNDLQLAIEQVVHHRPVTRPRTHAAGCVLELPPGAAPSMVP